MQSWAVPVGCADTSQGWRRFFGLYGVLGALIAPPITYIFLRNSPEEEGMLPDGLKAPPASMAELEASEDSKSEAPPAVVEVS